MSLLFVETLHRIDFFLENSELRGTSINREDAYCYTPRENALQPTSIFNAPPPPGY